VVIKVPVLIAIGVILVIVLNIVGEKAAWISAGLGLLLSVISFGALAVVGVILMLPIIARLVFKMLVPLFAVALNDFFGSK